jgi:hypothetical protein
MTLSPQMHPLYVVCILIPIILTYQTTLPSMIVHSYAILFSHILPLVSMTSALPPLGYTFSPSRLCTPSRMLFHAPPPPYGRHKGDDLACACEPPTNLYCRGAVFLFGHIILHASMITHLHIISMVARGISGGIPTLEVSIGFMVQFL